MPTIISIHRPGLTDRHCDAKCYDAEAKRCTCICRGRNHGVGLAAALALNLQSTEKEQDQMRLDSNTTIRPILTTSLDPLNRMTDHFRRNAISRPDAEP